MKPEGGEAVSSHADAAAPSGYRGAASSPSTGELLTLAPQDLRPEATKPFRAVGFALSSIGYAVSRGFRAKLAPLELEPREFALLRAVGVAEGQSQQAIGERLQIPPSRMVAFVDGLEGRGLLERRHNPHDRRTRELHLTPAGRELLERAFALAVSFERQLCTELGAEERAQLLELLHRVGAHAGIPPGIHAAHAHDLLGEVDEE